jgi:ribokinase
MSVAIFDDDGDYGAVIVLGSNLHIAPEQVAVDRLAGARVLVPAEMLGGGAVTSLDQALVAAKALTAQFRVVFVTAGGDGVAFADREGPEIPVPAAPVVVASTHGAGDAFVRTLAASLARGD